MAKKTAVIIGAGPGGLTAALELLRRTDIVPLVLEASDGVGGISRTFSHNGNRIDIGGHRFFSKSDRVMDWWAGILPTQGVQSADKKIQISYQNKSRWLDMPENGLDPDKDDAVMLVRPRKSRILYRGKLFEYPVSLSIDTLAKLGLWPTFRIGVSYVWSALFPLKQEKTLEDFMINRFGRELYKTFFRDYTEKVWGVPCSQISAEWGAQRIKGLSLTKAVIHAVLSLFGSRNSRNVETTLIEQFLYPKFGPGQIWEETTKMVEAAGGTVRLNSAVTQIQCEGSRVKSVRVAGSDGIEEEVACDYLFSTMPIKNLLNAMVPPPPKEILAIGNGLVYRDFITVGLLLNRLRLGNNCTGRNIAENMSDNWIYVQEPDVKVGRLQFFNNWSPYLVADPDKVWIGLEYFCDEGDALWTMDDEALAKFAIAELEKIKVIDASEVIDHTIVRVPKTYPAYFGSYDRFEELKAYLDSIENLSPIGRNGMHRYNNQDHSMLTAMTVVDNLIEGRRDKANVWAVNTEAEYHEEK